MLTPTASGSSTGFGLLGGSRMHTLANRDSQSGEAPLADIRLPPVSRPRHSAGDRTPTFLSPSKLQTLRRWRITLALGR